VLDTFARRARERDDQNAEPHERIRWLSDLLFHDLGFRGNAENYYDARNSFLNDVIDRRTGIPITLSVIFIEVARRIGLKLAGVGMPGHFIVKYADEDLEILIDPFNGGQLISQENLREFMAAMYGGKLIFQPSFLAAVTKKQILIRMLHNLKGIYAKATDSNKTLSVIERLLLIDSDAAAEIRDRGLVYFSMERYAQARKDLEEYLRRAPGAGDTEEIRGKLRKLLERQAQLN
jgi:regulator of sirC expression with transglutaminase-like and TPR domain